MGKSQLWDRICSVYSAARALPVGEHEAFLARECAGDDGLKREIQILLQLNDPPPGFLTSSNIQLPQATLAATPFIEPCCAPGEVLNNRFRIVRFLGAGGMGEVFEAMDTDLRDIVALKVLPARGLSDESLTARFRREIRLASRITHPNVCRVFYFDRHKKPDGTALHYYTMELLNGETLAARLGNSKLIEPETALEIARQMAEGLSSAHDAGIVHRDFKPANVMLIGSGGALRVAITDFGLATATDRGPHVSTLGSTGMILGTPGYVAPEQLFGGAVTPATDIYAFGIVLHELITRVHPRSPEASDAKIPEHWKAVISRCMELNPELRFPMARHAYAALASLPAGRTWTVSRRRVFAWTAAAAGAVALYPIIARIYEQYAHLPGGALVVVIPILNSSGDSKFDSLTMVLNTSLAQSAHFNVWNPQRLADVLRSMRLDASTNPDTSMWREIAFREKAPLLVFSTLGKLGAGYVLAIHAELIGSTPDQPFRSWDLTLTPGGPAALFDAIHAAARWIREVGGEDAASLSAHNRLPQDITSPSWEALDLFNQAQLLISSGRTSEAIPVLRRAVELDPQFATGLMRLGDILNTQRRSSEGFAYWQKAIAAARSQRLSEHETLNIESRYALEVADYAKAEVVLRDWVRKFPNDPVGQQLLASCLIDLGQYPEALEYGNRAETRFGPTSFGLETVLRGLMVANRTSEIAESLDRFQSVAPLMSALQIRGTAAAIREDYRTAEGYFQKMMDAGTREAVSRGVHLLGILASDEGKLEMAAGLFERGFKQDREFGETGLASRKAFALGFLHHLLGDRKLARAWSMEAVSAQPSPRVLTFAACTLCRSGYPEAAEKILEDFPNDKIPRYEFARLRIRGELALTRGNPSDALALFERAVPLNSAVNAKEYLARALDLAGQPERARFVYNQIVSTPYLIWDRPETEWPAIRYVARKRINSGQ